MSAYDMTETAEWKGMQAGAIPRLSAFKAAVTFSAHGQLIPPEDRATGCDISKWNGQVNFETMKGAGASFVYFKATQGTAYQDSQYNNSRANVGDLLPWGSYHFMSTGDGVAQASNFLDTMNGNGGLLPPVLDVELASIDSAIIRACSQRIYTVRGIYPIVYTSYYYWGKVTGSYKAWISEHCGLWVAHWQTDYPLLPTGWSDYLIHQYSANGNGLGQTYGAPPEGDNDMDLNRARKSWLATFDPQPTLEERVTALEAWVQAHG